MTADQDRNGQSARSDAPHAESCECEELRERRDAAMGGGVDAVNDETAAIQRSRAVDLIARLLTFTDWTRCTEDEVERAAVRLLERVEELHPRD